MTPEPPDPGFTPISPNPFIVGNPVRGRAMFFGREVEFELVRKRVEDSTHGVLLVFCGERRSGKTSILFQILDRRLGPDLIPVLIDMQSMAIGSEIEFLTRISEAVLDAVDGAAKGLTLPSFTQGSNHATTFQKFVRDVLRAHPGKKLILLFDEYELFENKIDAGQLAEDVLHILASLMENQPVFLIFTGSQHLEQRRKDYWKILGKSFYKMISFLEREDAMNLIQKPVEGRVHYGEGTGEAIHRLAAGQPFYTQAICQSLVDQLNERRTHHVTPAIVTAVVDGIVNNPLPQMIFLWDGLERDEKLVLALLAECLAGDAATAAVADLARHLKTGKYRLELESARIAITLEKLFKSEMLSRSDTGTQPAYAFRMDLWRLWIRRQHSVWQVMRELGVMIRTDRRARSAVLWAIGIGVPSIMGIVWALGPGCRREHALPSRPVLALFALDPEPAETMVYMDGHPLSSGFFRDSITAGQDHRFRLSAAGHADSEFVVRIAAGDSARVRIVLHPHLGSLEVETLPAGAEVKVDGRVVGRSPVRVPGLMAAVPHHVEASLVGHGAAQRDVTVETNAESRVSLTLEAATAVLEVTCDPSPSEFRMDHKGRWQTPTTIGSVASGSHAFSIMHDGYLPAETTIVVTPEMRRIHFALVPEPPGNLVVMGDRPAAEIWIDAAFVISGVQNSGTRMLPAGLHRVRVVKRSGEVVDTTVTIRSRERATFDYSSRTVTSRPEGNP